MPRPSIEPKSVTDSFNRLEISEEHTMMLYSTVFYLTDSSRVRILVEALCDPFEAIGLAAL